jgi:DNA-directed RNA polymerase subunit K/omega
MSDQIEPLEPADAGDAGAVAEPAAEAVTPEPTEPPEPLEPAEPIESRFLFVDVASRRANQLRRGALLRLSEGEGHHLPHKLERAAMEEVKQRLIHYELPDLPESTATKS